MSLAMIISNTNNCPIALKLLGVLTDTQSSVSLRFQPPAIILKFCVIFCFELVNVQKQYTGFVLAVQLCNFDIVFNT